MQYQEYSADEITKELLDTIKVGDTIRCNDWKRGMKVVGVSENYFLMASYPFGRTLYSICEKIPFKGIQYNSLIGGYFSIGTDNMCFGYPFGYDFKNQNTVKCYLNDLEKKELELSLRSSVALRKICIKRSTHYDV